MTVEFYDREMHRDFHFTDPYLYDRACLSQLKPTLSMFWNMLTVSCRRARDTLL